MEVPSSYHMKGSVFHFLHLATHHESRVTRVPGQLVSILIKNVCVCVCASGKKWQRHETCMVCLSMFFVFRMLGCFFGVVEMADLRGPSDGIWDDEHRDQNVVEGPDARCLYVALIVVVEESPCLLGHVFSVGARSHKTRHVLQLHICQLPQARECHGFRTFAPLLASHLQTWLTRSSHK